MLVFGFPDASRMAQSYLRLPHTSTSTSHHLPIVIGTILHIPKSDAAKGFGGLMHLSSVSSYWKSDAHGVRKWHSPTFSSRLLFVLCSDHMMNLIVVAVYRILKTIA